MTKLDWDIPDRRRYEIGLDRGVLFDQDGNGHAWNGLTSIVEKFEGAVESLYFDGVKYTNLSSVGDYAATLNALTYPDEFMPFDGKELVPDTDGFYIDNQNRDPFLYYNNGPIIDTFSLSYRVMLGDGEVGEELGYQIHILYNLTATPTPATYSTITDTPDAMTFSWDLSSIPEIVPGYRPTAHVIIDSTTMDPYLLKEIESRLYGTDSTSSKLFDLGTYVPYLNDWHKIQIIDNGDGTWTAIADSDFITMVDATRFRISGVSGSYLSSTRYSIQSTD